MNLKSLLKGVEVKGGWENPGPEISGIACHSAKVEKGFLFLAISGTKQRGESFIPEAIQRGAVAVAAEDFVEVPEGVAFVVVQNSRKALSMAARNFYNDPLKKIRMIGVTGTNGKTTTTYIVHSILTAAGERPGLLGTIRYVLGRREIKASLTTPEIVELMGFLREMVEENLSHAVIEVSSHALDQNRVSPEDFEVAVFTNLTRDHLDYHHTLEEYRNAKAILFRDLREGSAAILNRDDQNFSFFSRITRARVIPYGIENPSEIWGRIKRISQDGLSFFLRYGPESAEVSSSLIGRHNLYNILAAAGCCYALGIPLERVVQGIFEMKGVPGRMEIIEGGREVRVLVDYAHTDDALRNLLLNVRPLCEKRLVLVFGCGGDRDRGKRPEMGAVAEEFSDVQWITSDNPRSEDPIQIIQEIRSGFKRPERPCIEPNRESAIEKAIQSAKPGDLVVIAGKGHEDYQIIGNTVRPFSDREVAARVLAGGRSQSPRSPLGPR